ncbi:alcohol dehydrogenase [Purpureocillium lavendulum]|uniref:Alcohol dehydrogenase n=1 Tax=Purpureocillium lavendulum TaxID=1247861 RepID=A0AB34FKH1_9HYPO|nr:alcohol dehydrogenase [Purpureocillium lavendulum]
MQRLVRSARHKPLALTVANNSNRSTALNFATRYMATMKALVYSGANRIAMQERPKPVLAAPTDAIVKITKTTICGTDLHILKGDVATCKPGTILGHEGEGVVAEAGAAVTRFRPGDRVLVSCISSCAKCEYCRRGMYSHCTSGGWILGNTIDGTQAEYARIPHADASLHAIPEGVNAGAMVMLSDIFPTALECGVQNGKVTPGSTVAIVGSGPVGLAALMTAQMYSPAKVVVIDTDPKRLEVAKKLGATETINNGTDDALAKIQDLTGGKGCDTVIEAVGVPATFDLCQKLLAPGGVLANVGVHGVPVKLHLDQLWDKNIAITTRLVDAGVTPMLINQVAAGKLRPVDLVSHRFKFSDGEEAYRTFSQASETGALKVILKMGNNSIH